ncbi:MAG: tRNA (N6-isopentenyl adenosine(37)-C2)-methylthiotransferase MiaB [Chloroflexi bacterium]|nr:tRNA (N6-isopentenyl adenosine(37)-C2)-methylthiotransferase MiaB [Chloroflexota bacterium]|tara:strand:+ start:2868 stop:4160 length:1293 start_codon:yes stop_codon:yes gene_type:complete
MDTYNIWTIGCQMNKADSERLGSALDQMSLSLVHSPEQADVVVVNSCVVRKSAEDKVTGMLAKLNGFKKNNPSQVIALMGCMVGPKQDKLQKQFPFVDVFMRPQEYDPLLQLIGVKTGIDPDGCVGDLTATPGVTAFIPIIHGCDKFCSFCIIPYRRGREVSRTITDIVRETELLVARGVKEITLLGQNVDSYGHDFDEKRDLADLLIALNDVKDLKRIRFLTSHPNDMSDRIIDTVAQLDKVCEHINLPFQAGDDDVLEKMRRGYTNKEYRLLVDKIRDRIPNVSMGTDLIVGFSGETPEQFQKSVEMLEDIKFDKVHSASYSVREGTIAFRTLPDDVPVDEKKARLKTIDDLQKDIQSDLNAKLNGTLQEVLIEKITDDIFEGRTKNDKIVRVSGTATTIGEIIEVKIQKAGPWSLSGLTVDRLEVLI